MLLLLAATALAVGPTGPTCVGPEASGADEPRPALSGTAHSTDVDRFRLHWTDEGADALVDDGDGDGTPDLVELVGEALTQARQRFEADGWRALARDSGAGDSDAIDVYFLQIDANGYANPADPADDEQGRSCYIRLDPDIPDLGGDTMAASVAVHELHHCVQFRYTAQAASWVYEGQATLEQYRLVDDPVADAAVNVLWYKRLSEPERRIDATGGRFEYAGFVWFKYWEEATGGPLPDLWEALAEDQVWSTAFDVEAQRLGAGDLGDAYLDHAAWNAFACARDDGRHYAPEPAGCSEASLSAVPTTLTDPAAFEVDLADAYSARYLEIPHDGSSSQIRVSCDADDGSGELGLAVVDVASGAVNTGRVAGGGPATVDGPRTTGDAGTVIVVASLHPWGAAASCEAVRSPLDEEEEGGRVCATSPASAGWLWLLLPLLWRRRR